jgi:hypothetical protein
MPVSAVNLIPFSARHEFLNPSEIILASPRLYYRRKSPGSTVAFLTTTAISQPR